MRRWIYLICTTLLLASCSKKTTNPARHATTWPNRATLSSLRPLPGLDGRVVLMDYHGDYKLGEMVVFGVQTYGAEAFESFTYHIQHGVCMNLAEEKTLPIKYQSEGKWRVANIDDTHKAIVRNYQAKNNHQQGLLILHTSPAKGYEGLALAGLGGYGLTSAQLFDEKTDISPLLCAPYFFTDFINEKGLVMMSFQDNNIIEQETNNRRECMLTLFRLFCDNCATVNEALALLERYDCQGPSPLGFKMLLADATGCTKWVTFEDNTFTANDIPNVDLISVQETIESMRGNNTDIVCVLQPKKRALSFSLGDKTTRPKVFHFKDFCTGKAIR